MGPQEGGSEMGTLGRGQMDLGKKRPVWTAYGLQEGTQSRRGSKVETGLPFLLPQ